MTLTLGSFEDRYEVDYERHNHCPTCGQAIDWSDEK